MVSSDICGKEFENIQGLRGHKNFVHSDKAGSVGQPVAHQTTQQLVSSKLSTPATTEQRLSQLEDRFTILEHITGVRGTGELENLIGITDTSLAEQLKSEYVSTETMETIITELTGESDSLREEIADARNVSYSHGKYDTDTATDNVNDLSPIAALTGDTVLDEGQSGRYDPSGSTSIPDAIVSYEWDWDYECITSILPMILVPCSLMPGATTVLMLWTCVR